MSDEPISLTVKDVKDSVLDLKKRVDELADENSLKSIELEKAESQSNEVKVEVAMLKKRVESLDGECVTSSHTLEVMLNQIDHVGKVADENERWRKVYERKQTDNDERVEEMTTIVKAAYSSTESASLKYDDALERLHHTTESIRQMESKIDQAKKRIDEKEKEIKEKVAVYKKLQCQSEERLEKEAKKEEYINFLRKQVQEAELRADKAEAELVQKKSDIDRLRNKIKSENESVCKMKSNMTSLCSEFKKL